MNFLHKMVFKYRNPYFCRPFFKKTMAIIQKLRNSGAVVIAIIAALILFVVGDIISGSKISGMGKDDQDVVGVIFGEKLHEPELTKRAQEVYARESENPNFKVTENTEREMFEQSWTSILRDKTVASQIKKAGLYISEEDFNEMVASEYPADQLKQEQSLQTDGKYDPIKLKQYRDQVQNNPKAKAQLLAFFNDMKEKTIEQRYARYISKCVYTPKNERGYNYIATNQGVVGKLVSLNFNTVLDKDIKITDAILQEYLDKHKEEYKQNFDSRDISYVVWDVIPSKGDTMYANDQADAAAKAMAAETKPDTAGEGVVGFVSRGKLPADAPKEVSEQVWPSTLLQVVGPFYKEGKYSIYQKIAEKRDSMPMTHVAHILIKFDGSAAPNKVIIKDSIAALLKANELANQVRGGGDLGKLAAEWSMDPGSATNQGDYGWADPNTYVPEYKAFCIRAKKGTIEVVKTQFGYHVMKALDDPDFTQLKYRVKTITVSPGPETVKLVNVDSRKFYSSINQSDPKSFEAVRDKMALTPRLKKGIKTDDRSIPGLDQAADTKAILIWLFEEGRKANDVSDVFAFSSRHMVVMTTNVRKAGYATVADVKEKLEPLVRNELKGKKLEEKFLAAIKASKTPEELAQKTSGTLIDLDGLKMGGNFIPQLYNEPRILGAIFGVKEQVLSKPVSGASATVVIWINRKDKVEVPKAGLEDAMDFMNQPQYLMNRLQEVLRSSAEVQDYRYKFSWN